MGEKKRWKGRGREASLRERSTGVISKLLHFTSRYHGSWKRDPRGRVVIVCEEYTSESCGGKVPSAFQIGMEFH